jgi:hypothetical protein
MITRGSVMNATPNTTGGTVMRILAPHHKQTRGSTSQDAAEKLGPPTAQGAHVGVARGLGHRRASRRSTRPRTPPTR